MLCRRSGLIAAAVLAQSLAGCGTGSNVNRLFGGEDDAGDSRLVEAQAAYDRGDFGVAATLASELVARDADNEEAAILLGYINLSQGGIDPFLLANELIKLSPSKTAATGGTTGTTTGATTGALTDFAPVISGGTGYGEASVGGGSGAATTGTATGAATGGASAAATDVNSTLSQLSGLVTSLTDADKTTALGHMFVAADNNNLAPVLFTGANALVVPSDVDYSKPGMVPTLQYMSEAIKAVCRFVDDAAKPATAGDTRNCATTANTRHSAAKADFLWAFSHLTEALVFEQVLLYTPPGAAVPSLTDVTNSINKTQTITADATAFTTFIAQVSEVETAVNSVFNTGDDKSMIQAMLNDMNIVTSSFAALKGLPTSVTDKINTAFAQLDTLSKSFGGDLKGRTKALKTQFAQKLSGGLGTKIDAAANSVAKQYGATSYADLKAKAAADPKIANDPNYVKYASQVTTMCGSYTSLTKDIANAAKPAACP